VLHLKHSVRRCFVDRRSSPLRLSCLSSLAACITQGSAETRLSCGGIFNDLFIANFVQSVTGKCENRVSIWQRYGQELGVFYDSRDGVLYSYERSA